MNRQRRSAFTLIELLVVIAIIAILAAILFPVFAQAKAAAKATASLSNCKEMGLGQLMYMNDSDDQFSPVSEFGNYWEIRPFSFLQQPYMKSWGIVMDPLSPATVNSDPMVIRSQWAMAPRRVAVTTTPLAVGPAPSADQWTMGQTAQGAAFTGGRLFYYDGIAGVANDPNFASGNWADYGYQPGSTPSLSQTSVASPADVVMIAQASNYDYMWQFNGNSYGDFQGSNDTIDNFDLYWGDGQYNLYGTSPTICAPLARVRATGVQAGIIPDAYNSGSVGTTIANAPMPTGNTIYVAVDGHAKNVAWRSLMGSTVDIGGGKLAIKAFWPGN